ncbi:MAG: tripartite tricarboxylate transporter TctB family protein [Candidatus Accumulibacter sp.]|jgi:hypothetical protein|nr:tripartite tricarboxylate transporter TctB family protein [Accumulibacter sp.]
MLLVRKPKDFYAGVLFMAFGIAALVFSWAYPLGSASRMGAGYFPRVIAFLLIGGGAILVLSALCSAREQAKIVWRWRPLAIVLFSVCLFSWLMNYLGLVVTSLLLVLVSSYASPEFRWKEALINGLLLGLAAAALFVRGLAIPMPMWPAFLGGGA